MKKDLLLPTYYRRIGWFLFIPAALLGLFIMYIRHLLLNRYGIQIPFNDFWESFADELAALGILFGLLFIAFAREKTEDEMIRQLRLESLQWSVYLNYLLLALAIISVYDMAFFDVLIYNMFTILLVFIVRFRWSLKRIERTEEVIA